MNINKSFGGDKYIMIRDKRASDDPTSRVVLVRAGVSNTSSTQILRDTA